jgi:putative transposase
MFRGIEKKDIFCDDCDRTAFLDRLSKLLLKTGTRCLAWACMPNHVHLLLRTETVKLSTIMRSLLTGYAVVFNLRHHRVGHLFQNRYKSIVCDEDSYLLELVRYIHLNPLRGHLVDSLEMLDNYKWSGHAGMMGYGILSVQNVDEVLSLFDRDERVARQKYRAFVAEGIALGKRDELVGGGLKRYLLLSGLTDYQAYDERILGSGDFVEQLWQETELPVVMPTSVQLEELIRQVADVFDIDEGALRRGSNQKAVIEARGALCFIAARKLGFLGADIATSLNISRSGVVVASRRGERLYANLVELHALTSSSK